ncbi:zinc finger protein 862-like [Centroberyx gerrardi]
MGKRGINTGTQKEHKAHGDKESGPEVKEKDILLVGDGAISAVNNERIIACSYPSAMVSDISGLFSQAHKPDGGLGEVWDQNDPTHPQHGQVTGIAITYTPPTTLSTFLKPGKDSNPQSSGQFTAVYMHMDHLAGASANADIAGRIKATMEDGTFVAFCYFLSDLFSSISQFSLLLQRNDVILPKAVSGIESLLATIETMAARPKPDGKLSEFLAAMKEQHQQKGGETGRQGLKYQEVTLFKGEAAKLAEGQPISQCAPRLQRAIELTCESTVKHLKNRFSSLLEEKIKDTPTAKAVRCFTVFNHDSWPDDKLGVLDHGVEVKFLLEHFSTVLGRNGCNKEQSKEEFQEMKMTINTSLKDKSYLGLWEVMMTKEPYCSDYANILHLVKIMLVLPISAAVCERVFSTQNRIKSDVRASLHTDTVEDLIRISVEGPELMDYDARQDVKLWFSQGKRVRRPNYKELAPLS